MMAKASQTAHDISGVRAKVLSAAAAILAEHGVEELSLRLIAERAGIGLASIYHYFENKDDLLVSLALAGLEDLRRDILNYQRDPAFASPMRGGARAFFGFVEERPRLFSLMFSERLLARYEALREAERKVLLAYKAAVEADDRVPPQHQENAAYGLWALGRGMAAIIGSYPDGQVPPELLQKLFAGGAYLINHPE